MKELKFILGATLITAALTGCTSNAKTEDKSTNTEVTSEISNTKDDAEFLTKAAQINMEEIKVGQLAQQKGTAADVKQMGQMLVEDHTKSMNELTTLAKQKSVTLPTTLDKDAQSDYDKLNDKTGNDFDKKFIDMMISGHKDAISLFEKESKDAKDADVRRWAEETLPTLHKHLDQANKCQENMKKVS